MLPWALFGLTPRDMSGTLLRQFNRQSTITTVGLVHTHTFNIPPDNALVLLQWAVLALGGGAQQPTYAELDLFLPTANTANGFLTAAFPGSLGNPIATGIIGSISTPCQGAIVAPGGKLECNVNFSGGGVANTSSASILGVLIPRGDMAYV